MAIEFCPNCGTRRITGLRFCRSCRFDFDTLDQDPPTTATSQALTQRQAMARGAMTAQTLNCLSTTGAIIGALVGLVGGAHVGAGAGYLGQLVIAAILTVVGMIAGSRLALMLAAR